MKREKVSLPVDVRRSKTSLLKFPECFVGRLRRKKKDAQGTYDGRGYYCYYCYFYCDTQREPPLR